MRRGRPLLLGLLLLLCTVPIAAADDDGGGSYPPRAFGVTADQATLTAWVPTGSKAAFEYGTTTAYGKTVTALTVSLPGSAAVATATVTGLEPATTHHFRVVLAGSVGSVYGPDATFTTAPGTAAAAPGDPTKETAPPPAPVRAPAPPVLGKSLTVGAVAGRVRVRTPDGSVVTLGRGANVPTGAIVDATAGAVAITSALDSADATQTGLFGGGRFVVRQRRRGKGMVDIYLRGSLGRCRAGAASIARKGRRTLSLWGSDHGGRYRTHGANSVATVRGTRWLMQDSCAGTLTRVTEGVVSVRDLRRHRTVTVRAGQAYLARRGR